MNKKKLKEENLLHKDLSCPPVHDRSDRELTRDGKHIAAGSLAVTGTSLIIDSINEVRGKLPSSFQKVLIYLYIYIYIYIMYCALNSRNSPTFTQMRT